MHEGQLHIDAAGVRNLLRRQRPDWADLPVRGVASDGTVNALFRLGDELVARFPIEPGDPAQVLASLQQEAEAARHLRRVSPVPTPDPVAVLDGESGIFPLPWSVYRWLPGTVATATPVAGSSPFAVGLAEFVMALRDEPTGGRVFTGTHRGGHLTDMDDYVAQCLRRSVGLIDVDAVAALWATLRVAPRTEPDVWSHGDLMPGNLLVDGERLVAVIDVGQFGVADPALDLQPAWNLLTPDARASFRAALDADDAQWDRGRGWSLAQAMGCLWYYRETNPPMSRIAEHTLQQLLADAARGAG